MYYITLTTQCELDDEQFGEVYGILDSVFGIGSVLTFDEEGSKIDTVATMAAKENGFEYTYDVENKAEPVEGDHIVKSLSEVLDCDFELDAPIIKEEGVDYEN